MSQRVYQSIRAIFLSSYVRLNGKLVQVKFTGGQRTPKRTNGKFSTNDPDMQRALETSPEYGKNWRRIIPPEGEIVKDRPPEMTIITEPEVKVQPPAADRVMVATETSPLSISGLINAQQVKNYILENYTDRFKFKELMSKGQIYAAAKALNLIFPDWQYSE